MTTISANTILRSRNASSPEHVLSTLVLRYPLWIHAELLTHRQFSRNASSTRAIPFAKMIEDIRRDPAVPLYWSKNQKGMTASEETSAPIEHGDFLGSGAQSNEQAWLFAMNDVLAVAEGFNAVGYHKQVVNRLLSPWLHITCLVSATEWDNFLALRDHPDAEPHIQMLAREIRRELEREDNIQTLRPGEWHLPFMSVDRSLDVYATHKGDDHLNAMIAYSVACCASTSYKTVDGFDMTIERAIALHDKLVGSRPIHASPCEHVAQADNLVTDPSMTWSRFGHPEQHRNFRGFRQYRAMIEEAA